LKLKLRRRLQAIREAWHQGREAWRQDILPWWHTPDKKPAGRQLRELWVAWRTYRRIPGQYFRYCAYCWDIDDPQAYLPRLLIAKTQKALNSRADRRLTLDKQRFRVAMEAAGLPAVRELFTIGLDGMITDAMDCALTRTEAEARIADYGKDLFVKPVDGAFGIDASILALGSGTQALFDGRAWIVQPRLVQHSVLSKIYPGAINTIRIDTLVTGDQVEFGSAILRIGLGGRVVDNGRAGGLSAAVDIETGRICRPALREPLFDPARTPYDRHPDTGEPILGVELPFWADLRGLVSTAAQSCGRSAGTWCLHQMDRSCLKQISTGMRISRRCIGRCATLRWGVRPWLICALAGCRAARASHPGPDKPVHDEPARNVFQFLGDVFAECLQHFHRKGRSVCRWTHGECC
jgi:hypothetical protein